MMNEDFDKVYLINLDSASERLGKVTEQLEKNEISFERVRAIPGKEVEFDGEPTDGWNANAKALALTTIGIIEDAKKNDYEQIFIFEDDAQLVHNFKSLYKTVMYRLPETWEFLHLAAFHKEPPKNIGPNLVRIKSALCCQAYGINSRVYDVYLEELKKLSRPIDETTAILHRRGSSYACSVNAVTHPARKYSTLREKIVNY